MGRAGCDKIMRVCSIHCLMPDIIILVTRPARINSLQSGSRWQTFLFSLLVLLEEDLLIDFVLLLTCRHGLALEPTLGDEVGGRGTGGRGGCHKDYCFRVDASGHCSLGCLSPVEMALTCGVVDRKYVGENFMVNEYHLIANTGGEKKDFCGKKKISCVSAYDT